MHAIISLNAIVRLCLKLTNETPPTLLKILQDVVLLQEIFLQRDAKALISAASVGGLLHTRQFRGGVLGGELLTLSRYHISRVRPDHADSFPTVETNVDVQAVRLTSGQMNAGSVWAVRRRWRPCCASPRRLFRRCADLINMDAVPGRKLRLLLLVEIRYFKMKSFILLEDSS